MTLLERVRRVEDVLNTPYEKARNDYDSIKEFLEEYEPLLEEYENLKYDNYE